jgi:D-xylose 1-dehydrogenase (NADP+, D-xylono-1,5-lactone-forming)
MRTIPLRIGVLGTANIARKFIHGVQPSRKVQVTRVASRDLGRAAAFAEEFCLGPPHSYESMLVDTEIDAVYVPLPNSLHEEWSIRAVEAGKHVLCEKPLATTHAAAKRMYEAARTRGVYLAEAYPYISQPQTIELRKLLRDGVIGKVRIVRATFGFALTELENIRWDPNLGAGSLLDVGCYTVSLVRLIAGVPPIRVHSAADWSAPGVDRSMVATLEHSNGLLAQVSCSFGIAPYRHASFAGSAGIIETTYANHTSTDSPAVLSIKRGIGWQAPDESLHLPETNGFLAEAESFADMIENGEAAWTGISAKESLDVARTLDALAESAHSGRAIEIPPMN